MEVKVPQLPESVTDATLITWHRKVGEAVKRDENLVDLETDKVVLEVPAPSDGVLQEIRIADGTTVTSGEVLAVIAPGAAPAEAAEPDAPAAETAAEPVQAVAPPADADAGPAKMGPAVRALLEEHDLDLSRIQATGRDGRLTKGDVLNYLEAQRSTNVGMDEGPGDEQGSAMAPVGQRLEQRVQMTRLRQRIAERLVNAQQTAAMLTTFNEADMSAIVALRKKYQESFQKQYEVKLGFMSFFVRAVTEALRAYPILNASVDGNEIVYHEYFDIGVAVSTERGLMVPVLRDAINMSMGQIETSIREFGTRARSGDIGMEELTGGTFTITNGGIFGSMLSTPILNPPQSGILGMHAIQDRPVVVDGEMAIRPMMYLALSYDHRIVDGREAVQFLVHIKQALEDPARLVLQI